METHELHKEDAEQVRSDEAAGLLPEAKKRKGWPACPRCDSIDVWLQHIDGTGKWRLACHTCGLRDRERSYQQAQSWSISYLEEEEGA